MFCVVVCHVWLSYVNLSGTGIHKNRGALIYPCRLSSSFLHYWLLSWPSTGSTAFTEWSPLLCTTFDRSWQSTTEYIFLFLSSCLTWSDLSFHEGMNVFFSFSSKPYSTATTSTFLKPRFLNSVEASHSWQWRWQSCQPAYDRLASEAICLME